LFTGADITAWLPGDNLFDGAVKVPANVPPGPYELGLALVDPQSQQPKLKLAIAGRDDEGWYAMGKIRVEPTQP
jgi:hypothetical protein